MTSDLSRRSPAVLNIARPAMILYILSCSLERCVISDVYLFKQFSINVRIVTAEMPSIRLVAPPISAKYWFQVYATTSWITLSGNSDNTILNRVTLLKSYRYVQIEVLKKREKLELKFYYKKA